MIPPNIGPTIDPNKTLATIHELSNVVTGLDKGLREGSVLLRRGASVVDQLLVTPTAKERRLQFVIA